MSATAAPSPAATLGANIQQLLEKLEALRTRSAAGQPLSSASVDGLLREIFDRVVVEASDVAAAPGSAGGPHNPVVQLDHLQESLHPLFDLVRRQQQLVPAVVNDKLEEVNRQLDAVAAQLAAGMAPSRPLSILPPEAQQTIERTAEVLSRRAAAEASAATSLNETMPPYRRIVRMSGGLRATPTIAGVAIDVDLVHTELRRVAAELDPSRIRPDQRPSPPAPVTPDQALAYQAVREALFSSPDTFRSLVTPNTPEADALDTLRSYATALRQHISARTSTGAPPPVDVLHNEAEAIEAAERVVGNVCATAVAQAAATRQHNAALGGIVHPVTSGHTAAAEALAGCGGEVGAALGHYQAALAMMAPSAREGVAFKLLSSLTPDDILALQAAAGHLKTSTVRAAARSGLTAAEAADAHNAEVFSPVLPLALAHIGAFRSTAGGGVGVRDGDSRAKFMGLRTPRSLVRREDQLKVVLCPAALDLPTDPALEKPQAPIEEMTAGRVLDTPGCMLLPLEGAGAGGATMTLREAIRAAAAHNAGVLGRLVAAVGGGVQAVRLATVGVTILHGYTAYVVSDDGPMGTAVDQYAVAAEGGREGRLLTTVARDVQARDRAVAGLGHVGRGTSGVPPFMARDISVSVAVFSAVAEGGRAPAGADVVRVADAGDPAVSGAAASYARTDLPLPVASYRVSTLSATAGTGGLWLYEGSAMDAALRVPTALRVSEAGAEAANIHGSAGPILLATVGTTAPVANGRVTAGDALMLPLSFAPMEMVKVRHLYQHGAAGAVDSMVARLTERARDMRLTELLVGAGPSDDVANRVRVAELTTTLLSLMDRVCADPALRQPFFAGFMSNAAQASRTVQHWAAMAVYRPARGAPEHTLDVPGTAAAVQDMWGSVTSFQQLQDALRHSTFQQGALDGMGEAGLGLWTNTANGQARFHESSLAADGSVRVDRHGKRIAPARLLALQEAARWLMVMGYDKAGPLAIIATALRSAMAALGTDAAYMGAFKALLDNWQQGVRASTWWKNNRTVPKGRRADAVLLQPATMDNCRPLQELLFRLGREVFHPVALQPLLAAPAAASARMMLHTAAPLMRGLLGVRAGLMQVLAMDVGAPLEVAAAVNVDPKFPANHGVPRGEVDFANGRFNTPLALWHILEHSPIHDARVNNARHGVLERDAYSAQRLLGRVTLQALVKGSLRNARLAFLSNANPDVVAPAELNATSFTDIYDSIPTGATAPAGTPGSAVLSSSFGRLAGLPVPAGLAGTGQRLRGVRRGAPAAASETAGSYSSSSSYGAAAAGAAAGSLPAPALPSPNTALDNAATLFLPVDEYVQAHSSPLALLAVAVRKLGAEDSISRRQVALLADMSPAMQAAFGSSGGSGPLTVTRPPAEDGSGPKLGALAPVLAAPAPVELFCIERKFTAENDSAGSGSGSSGSGAAAATAAAAAAVVEGGLLFEVREGSSGAAANAAFGRTPLGGRQGLRVTNSDAWKTLGHVAATVTVVRGVLTAVAEQLVTGRGGAASVPSDVMLRENLGVIHGKAATMHTKLRDEVGKLRYSGSRPRTLAELNAGHQSVADEVLEATARVLNATLEAHADDLPPLVHMNGTGAAGAEALRFSAQSVCAVGSLGLALKAALEHPDLQEAGVEAVQAVPGWASFRAAAEGDGGALEATIAEARTAATSMMANKSQQELGIPVADAVLAWSSTCEVPAQKLEAALAGRLILQAAEAAKDATAAAASTPGDSAVNAAMRAAAGSGGDVATLLGANASDDAMFARGTLPVTVGFPELERGMSDKDLTQLLLWVPQLLLLKPPSSGWGAAIGGRIRAVGDAVGGAVGALKDRLWGGGAKQPDVKKDGASDSGAPDDEDGEDAAAAAGPAKSTGKVKDMVKDVEWNEAEEEGSATFFGSRITATNGATLSAVLEAAKPATTFTTEGPWKKFMASDQPGTDDPRSSMKLKFKNVAGFKAALEAVAKSFNAFQRQQ